MKQWFSAVLLIGILAASTFAAGKGPEIQVRDNKVSMTAEAESLGRLLRLFDQATGMKSTVPPELANRNISVRFSDLTFDDAVRKIFEGQPLDYVVISGQGIIVTAVSQSITTSGPPTAISSVGQPQPQQPYIEESQPFFPPAGQPMPQPVMPNPAGQPNPQLVPGANVFANNPFNAQQQQQQPAVIQTPFGPIPNPRANQPVQPNGMPLTTPGQQMYGATNPFAPTNTFGGQNSASQTDVFGNTSPPMFNPNPSPMGTPGAPAQPGMSLPGQTNPLLPRKP